VCFSLSILATYDQQKNSLHISNQNKKPANIVIYQCILPITKFKKKKKRRVKKKQIYNNLNMIVLGFVKPTTLNLLAGNLSLYEFMFIESMSHDVVPRLPFLIGPKSTSNKDS
jgi:hypothetical protein